MQVQQRSRLTYHVYRCWHIPKSNPSRTLPNLTRLDSWSLFLLMWRILFICLSSYSYSEFSRCCYFVISTLLQASCLLLWSQWIGILVPASKSLASWCYYWIHPYPLIGGNSLNDFPTFTNSTSCVLLEVSFLIVVNIIWTFAYAEVIYYANARVNS